MPKRPRGSTTNVLCGQLHDDFFEAIDPGVSYFGWALFNSGRLMRCGLSTGYHVGAIALVERPIFRPGSEADPRDIVDLAYTAGQIGGHFGQAWCVEPHDWKGTVKGQVFLNRIRRELKHGRWQADAAVIDVALAEIPNKMHEHVLDAYALGKWGCGESLD